MAPVEAHSSYHHRYLQLGVVAGMTMSPSCMRAKVLWGGRRNPGLHYSSYYLSLKMTVQPHNWSPSGRRRSRAMVVDSSWVKGGRAPLLVRARAATIARAQEDRGQPQSLQWYAHEISVCLHRV